MEPFTLLAVALAAVGVVALVAGLQQRTATVGGEDPSAYLRSLDEDPVATTDEFALILGEPFLQRVLRPLGSRTLGGLAHLLPSNYRDSVHEKLVKAGLTGQVRAEELLTGQVLLGGVGFVLAVAYSILGDASGSLGLLALVAGPGVGAALPNAWLNRRVNARQSAIRDDLPDTLDLMAISVEAGVAFEGALAVVVERFDSPLSRELGRTLQEMELGLSRREALQNLKRRTEVPELSNFVLTLTQADALGMPIGRVLKSQAGELRIKRRQWAREKAGKLPIKILFPLMLFIFPPLFVILLGPAMSEISEKL